MIQNEDDDVAQGPGSSIEGHAAVKQPAVVGNHHPDRTDGGGNNDKRLRRRKKLPPHRHILPQRKVEEDAVKRGAISKRPLEKSLDDIDRFRRNVSALVVFLLIGVIGLVYVRPTIFFARRKEQRLPRRTITTVFPRHLHIGQALPPVVMGYGTSRAADYNVVSLSIRPHFSPHAADSPTCLMLFHATIYISDVVFVCWLIYSHCVARQ
jgi:hypothetical protein